MKIANISTSVKNFKIALFTCDNEMLWIELEVSCLETFLQHKYEKFAKSKVAVL